MTVCKRRRWAVLSWNKQTRAARLVGFVLAEGAPDALGRAFRRWPDEAKAALFVREAWRDAPNHYAALV